jgi:hypothetical protein
VPDVRHKFDTLIADDGTPTGGVGSDEWNDDHTWPHAQDQGHLTLASGQFELQGARLVISSTNRLVLSGTARINLFGYTDGLIDNLMGEPRYHSVSFRVPTGWQYRVQDRLVLIDNCRAILEGTSDTYIYDVGSTSRMRLPGRG